MLRYSNTVHLDGINQMTLTIFTAEYGPILSFP
jgi:hypothetical protein